MDALPHPEPGILLAAALGLTLVAFAGLILFIGRRHARRSSEQLPVTVAFDRARPQAKLGAAPTKNAPQGASTEPEKIRQHT